MLLNFWRSGQKVSGDEMCPVLYPTNPQNPIANKLPVVKIFGGERVFFSFLSFVSHARLSETLRFAVVWLVVIIDERYIRGHEMCPVRVPINPQNPKKN